ncbi:MAG TPA: SRPBCC family protein [Frankiaceae bacterium]|nr:SRPBCC family protein [Frankiaceae bacterium]
MPDHANESMTIKADPAKIMAVIADFPAYPEWAGPVKKMDVLEEGPGGRAKAVRFHVEIMGLADVYTNEYTWDGDRRVDWTMREGRSQKSQVGSYEMKPAAGGATTVTYDLTVEIAIPVPGLIRRRIQAKIVDTALKDLKKRCEA